MLASEVTASLDQQRETEREGERERESNVLVPHVGSDAPHAEKCVGSAVVKLRYPFALTIFREPAQ